MRTTTRTRTHGFDIVCLKFLIEEAFVNKKQAFTQLAVNAVLNSRRCVDVDIIGMIEGIKSKL